MIEDSLEGDLSANEHIKMYHFSFVVPEYKVKLLQALLDHRAAGGNLSSFIRDHLERSLESDLAIVLRELLEGEVTPKWFERWASMVPMVQQQVEDEVAEDIKIDLGGLGYD